mmetsp:Transcript_20264/g.25015  ORF Transcript_20264/g.25015 Transcript_20264/m.25015 type:complete len:158 (-) Transcript_20264:157-630(-)|eukprot:CAMPEP_0170463478 /NCGR_PEP_ID=MMETSP0123-20130129/8574_1 /TAXON_ID=182087 /ORGANISM="Favella ehrenbergii, Strain Fehren 1" /LENGTH=157 /DNA_ID=CAMNT_0010728919 /DNA_START=1843 /DNA_END=2316 /DNA_ORIENTATION=-
MRRIKFEGPYEGKNKVKLDAEGKTLKKTEFDSDYLQSLREGKGANADGTSMNIVRDKDVKAEVGQQDRHVERVKKDIAKNLAVDDQTAKDRIKEKRIKLKKRLRAEMGLDSDGGEGADAGVVLGTPSEGSQGGSGGDNDDGEAQSASEASDNDESIE